MRNVQLQLAAVRRQYETDQRMQLWNSLKASAAENAGQWQHGVAMVVPHHWQVCCLSQLLFALLNYCLPCSTNTKALHHTGSLSAARRLSLGHSPQCP